MEFWSNSFVVPIALCCCSAIAYASPILTADCSQLHGVKLVGGGAKQPLVRESHSGNPILFVDSDNPKKLVSHWKMKLFEKETTDSYEAVIVELSPSLLHAVERDGIGLYSYTLFLKTGTLFYSHHRLQSALDNAPSLLSFVGQCAVKVQ